MVELLATRLSKKLNEIIKKYKWPLMILSKNWTDRRELVQYFANSQVFLLHLLIELLDTRLSKNLNEIIKKYKIAFNDSL